MNKTNLTRREARTIPPEGGIFLCPERVDPEYIERSLTGLNRDRTRSIRANAVLKKAHADWEERQMRGEVRPYGKELESYIRSRAMKPEDRTMQPDIAHSVELIEQLYNVSSLYMGACDAIRSLANKVSSGIAGQMELGDVSAIGLHEYSRVSGPFGYEFLSRLVPDSDSRILFDWGGEVDGNTLMHAQFSDQVVLLSDVSVHYREASHS